MEYTDGDREDMNKDEVVYANEFYVQVSGIDDDTPEGSLHTESGEEESYVPSPQVKTLFLMSSSYVMISSHICTLLESGEEESYVPSPQVKKKKNKEIARD